MASFDLDNLVIEVSKGITGPAGADGADGLDGGAAQLGSPKGSLIEHNNLAGLTTGNPHTQYSQTGHSHTESDISDLGAYLTVETNDLSAAVTWANIPDANVPESAVTQHESAITVTESQVSDLGSYVAVGGNVSDLVNDAGYLTTAGGSPVPEHSHTESDITDLGSYLTVETNDLSAAVTWANIPDINVPESAVTQHSAALTITESQISDLGHLDLGSPQGSILSHTALQDVGTNTHPQIDTAITNSTNHIADSTIHQTQTELLGSPIGSVINTSSLNNDAGFLTSWGSPVPTHSHSQYLENVLDDTSPQLSANLDLNSNTITGFTVSRALETDGSGNLQVSAVTSTELNYLDGVTSAIQTQLNGKATTSHTHVTSDIIYGTFTDARIAESNVTQHRDAVIATAINSQSGTSYTVLTTDANDTIILSNAAAIILTIGTGLSGLSNGTQFIFIQGGAGSFTITASGTTINKPTSKTLVSAEQNAIVTMIKTGTNTYYVDGNLEAA